ncbi:Copper amine oxidase N-terminal domain-containing protein [Paenibacillus sp. 1_12]|uniref:stalk domain-containing protein n=1 Tax=Paenibacillus sp. 1_12 TaxID=1566278 RepID=UPI0008EB40A9|nr:stalk domain-containing protein [Paenibacillus sp. 1_12]SFL69434.1 Copper amine oxidase N-terminal domain-containing protein [Paenibacillus sp. 1_12]
MKKFMLVASVLFVSLISTTNADQLDKITKYPVHLLLNGNEKKLPKETEIYNINGISYVPLRYIVRELGGEVFYNQESESVSINQFQPIEKYSSMSSITKFDDFILELHSEKSEYKPNEFIHIWASLAYQGEEMTTIKHGSPTLTFSITDKEGVREGGYQATSQRINELNKGNQIINSFPLSTILEYNYRKSGMKSDYNSFLEKSNASYLPVGAYAITVYAGFLKGDTSNNRMVSKAEIQINVK